MRDPPPTLIVAGSQVVATILVKTNEESLLSETKTTEPGRQRTSYFAK